MIIRRTPANLPFRTAFFTRNSGAIWVSGQFSLDLRNNILFGSGNGQELVCSAIRRSWLASKPSLSKRLKAANGVAAIQACRSEVH